MITQIPIICIHTHLHRGLRMSYSPYPAFYYPYKKSIIRDPEILKDFPIIIQPKGDGERALTKICLSTDLK